jgi:hypothetical protein
MEYLTRNLPAIQELLDGVYGMTGRERQALNILRSVRVRMKRGEKLADFSENEAAVIVDAISVIHAGLKVKDDYVTGIGEKLTVRALVLQNVSKFDFRSGVTRRRGLYNTYKAWFNGDIYHLFDQPDIVSDIARENVVPGIRKTLTTGGLGKNITLDEISLIEEINDSSTGSRPGAC